MPPEEPCQRRFKTNDGTVAKIGDILAGSPAGLLVFRDELVGLLASWEREGHEGDRAFYLEGFNGTGSVNIDRIGRGSQFVKTLCLSVFGGIQPEMMERYLGNIVTSLDNDGRVQRFQMLVYPEAVPWVWRDRHPVTGLARGGARLVRLPGRLRPVAGRRRPADDFVKLPWFHFDDAAQEVFIEWATDLHINRIAAEQNPLMRQHLAKFEKLFCALALILHLAEGRVGPVRAIRRCVPQHGAPTWRATPGVSTRWWTLRPCQRRGSSAAACSMRKLHEGFTARDVVRKGWTGLKTTLQAESALAVLEEHGWVVGADTTENIGRPTTKYYINPHIHRGAP